MCKNNEQMVEATAPIKEFKPVSTDLLDYMNQTTIAYFIAETYSNVITYYEEYSSHMTRSMTVLVDAILHLKYSDGIEDSLDNIMKILKEEYGIETTEIDKLILIFIAEEEEDEPIDYYRSKAADYLKYANLLNKYAA